MNYGNLCFRSDKKAPLKYRKSPFQGSRHPFLGSAVSGLCQSLLSSLSLFLLLFLLLLLPLLSCSQDQTAQGQPEVTKAGGQKQIFPKDAPLAVVKLPGYSRSIQKLATMIQALFDQEGWEDLRRNFFANASRQLNINLLDKAALEKTGLYIDKPFVVALFSGKRYFVSLPLQNRQKTAEFLNDLGLNLEPRELTKGQGSRRLAYFRAEQLQGLLGPDRLSLFFAFSTNLKSLAGGSAPDLKLQTEEGQLMRARVHPRYLRASGIAVNAANPVHVSLHQSKEGGRNFTVDLESRWISIPFIESALKMLADIKRNSVFVWDSAGTGTLPLKSPTDIIILESTFHPRRIWLQTIKPRLVKMARAQVKQSGGDIGNFVSDLFQGEKSLEEKLLENLNIDKEIVARLSGKAAFVLQRIGPLALSGFYNSVNNRLLQESRGILAVECRNSKDPEAIIHYIRNLGSRFNFSLPGKEVKGTKMWVLRAPGSPLNPLYLSTTERYLLISHDSQFLAARARQGYQSNPASWNSPLLQKALKSHARRFYLHCSIQPLYQNITKTFDARTKANLRPLESQIKKIARISLLNSARDKKQHFFLEVAFRKDLPEINPFTRSQHKEDLLLWGLGIFFASLIAIAVIRYVYKKIRYRP